jgi:Peptidase family M28
MKKNLLALFLVLSFIVPLAAQKAIKIDSNGRKAANNITAAQMKDYLYFIASDEMEGRDTPSRGLDTTAKFIGMNLSRWGFKPAGDNGTFYQTIALKKNAPPAPAANGQPARRVRPYTFDLNQKYDPATMSGPDYVKTQNVVAIWEGSDPVLKNEYVAIGAHYDHVGVNPNAPGDDKIWNGADDDGSGTTGVLAIAEALAKSPKRPKRSILFVWHMGEEKGLWGSAYFNKYPTVDVKNVVAQLNIDMIGRSRKAGDTNPKNAELTDENSIYVIGSKMMSTMLGDVTAGVNNAYLKMNYDYRFDDPNDKNRFFFRSDHFNYAQNGIPISFWFDGVHEDYHGAGDSPDKIDYQKMEKVTRTIFLTGWELANMKDRPKIDKQLPPELTRPRN